MSWLRRLFRSSAKPTEANGHSRSDRGPQAMPIIKFDPSTVSESVKADLRRNIQLLDDLEKEDVQPVYAAALRSVLAGGDLHVLYTTLMKIEGMTKRRAAEIARSLNNKASAQINNDRRASLGITHALWMYANAPCMKYPKRPTNADIQQDAAHRSANGKRYEIDKGLFVDDKWTQPGVEEGCRCSSRSVMPWS